MSTRRVRALVGIGALLLVVACGRRPVEPVQIGQHPYTWGRGRSEVNYLLFLPQEYGQEEGKRWPLLLFLHGIDKRGDTQEELERLKTDGPPMIVEQHPDFPFIVLSPQCPSNSYWMMELDTLDALLDEIEETYAVDRDRVYLTGLSMGGFGAWHWALQDPDRFAAVVPIAGGYVLGSDSVPRGICDLKDLPLWVFHGAEDEVVSARHSEVLVEALRGCPSEVKFTLYEHADHDDAWMLAYSDLALYDWLLEHRRR